MKSVCKNDIVTCNKRDGLTGYVNEISKIDDSVEIIWTDGITANENTEDLTVIDRGFMHNSLVVSALDENGQLGIVFNVHKSVDLFSKDGEWIKNVCSTEIKHFREFNVQDVVIMGSCIGTVTEVLDELTIRFDDGSVTKLDTNDPLKLKLELGPIKDRAYCPYYPGQRVNSTDCEGDDGFKQPGYTVIKVETASVNVYWDHVSMLDVLSMPHVLLDQFIPADKQNPKDLNLLLSLFTETNLRLGHWCMLPSAANPETVFKVAGISTTVDVLWQDATRAYKLPSTALIGHNTPNKAFFPGQYVKIKKEASHTGVVQSVSFEKETASVRCLKRHGFGFNTDEMVGVCALEPHPSYYYRYADVVRLTSPSTRSEFSTQSNQKEDCKKVTSLSRFGTVADQRDGYIEVQWGDGHISKVGPWGIVLVKRYDDNKSTDVGSDMKEDEDSCEINSDCKLSGMESDSENERYDDNKSTDVGSDMEEDEDSCEFNPDSKLSGMETDSEKERSESSTSSQENGTS